MAKSFHQIAEFGKTINKSLNYIEEAEKTIAKITGIFSDKYINKD